MANELDKIAKLFVDSFRATQKKKTSAYDSQATVVRVEENIAWVHIPGGVDETPARLTMSAAPGDVVQVRVSGGRAWLTGNATTPPTGDGLALIANENAMAVAKDLSQATLVVGEIDARVAVIETAYISTAEVETLLANYATIDTLEANYATIEDLHTNYATINLANVQDGSITNAMIGAGVVGTAQIADGAITSAKIVELDASKIKTGTLDASVLNVINLSAASITVGMINGNQIADGAIGFDNLNVAVTESIDTATVWVLDTFYTTTDTTYEFEAHLYHGTEEVTEDFEDTKFKWLARNEDGDTFLGRGYTIEIDRSVAGYVGTIVCQFNDIEESYVIGDNDEMVIGSGGELLIGTY